MGKMRAAVLVAPRQFELREVPLPVMGPDDVLIRVLRTGICGTDMHIWNGHYAADKLPMVPGHEFCGRIAALGERVGILRNVSWGGGHAAGPQARLRARLRAPPLPADHEWHSRRGGVATSRPGQHGAPLLRTPTPRRCSRGAPPSTGPCLGSTRDWVLLPEDPLNYNVANACRR